MKMHYNDCEILRVRETPMLSAIYDRIRTGKRNEVSRSQRAELDGKESRNELAAS